MSAWFIENVLWKMSACSSKQIVMMTKYMRYEYRIVSFIFRAHYLILKSFNQNIIQYDTRNLNEIELLDKRLHSFLRWHDASERFLFKLNLPIAHARAADHLLSKKNNNACWSRLNNSAFSKMNDFGDMCLVLVKQWTHKDRGEKERVSAQWYVKE